MIQKSFVMMKPDAVQRRLMGKILSRFEEKGLQIVAVKLMQINEDLAVPANLAAPEEQITPTSIDVFAGTFKAFFNIHAITRDVVIVQIMIGSDCFPV